MKRLLVSYIKGLYSWFVGILSNKYQQSTFEKQVCYLMSFPNNDHGLIEEISKKYPVFVFYTKQCENEVNQLSKHNVHSYCIDSYKGLIKAIKLVSCSKVIIADNYFAFLGDCHFSKEQIVVQLWHATGAIKQFGLEDKQAKNRPEKDKKRFKRVYDSFDYVFVASSRMADVFKRSYGFEDTQILYTGFPRTDYLLNDKFKQTPSDKRMILYLPTYRDGQEPTKWLLDIKEVSKVLGEKDVLQVKLHPHVDMIKPSTDNVQWLDSSQSADELIKQADVLITDYSSAAFDFTLANKEKQLIMYWPDEAEYRQKTGIQKGIEHDFPEKITYTTQEVINQLMKQSNNSNESFNNKWNTYNDGNATNRVIDEIKKWMEKNGK